MPDSVPAGVADRGKFQDPDLTADGSRRAQVALRKLETLWINTGTLCNLACRNCYIESSPRNDRLAYIRADEVAVYLDEVARTDAGTRVIGFTGGEPFMNPHFTTMLADALERGFETLTLTNAMRPMMKHSAALLELRARHGGRIRLRVSLDHYTKALHDTERGERCWEPALAGLSWLD
ncbi:MAG: radical SAM protein, partial [Alphaproteobacteria bacterium]|nr:radical SAM protein [Alphaproteobacteria bacterium]